MSDTNFVEVGPKGRVVIPAQVRRRLGIEQGTRLIVLVDDDAVVLVPRAAIERRLHAIFKGVPVSMADELLEERRAEAAAEADAPWPSYSTLRRCSRGCSRNRAEPKSKTCSMGESSRLQTGPRHFKSSDSTAPTRRRWACCCVHSGSMWPT